MGEKTPTGRPSMPYAELVGQLLELIFDVVERR